MQIKTGRFMFFITRLTENTNLAASIPPSEQIFNAARVNISLARARFAELDVMTGKHRSMQQQFVNSLEDSRGELDKAEATSGMSGAGGGGGGHTMNAMH